MYVTAHHVRRHPGEPREAEGINAFVHLHGPAFTLPRDARYVPDNQPGREVVDLRDVTVPPGGNEVRSWLDVVAPDGTDISLAKGALDQARVALAEDRLPLVVQHGEVTIRFGLVFGLYAVCAEEFDRLAARVIDRWGRILQVAAA